MSDPALVLDMINGYRRSKTMFAAVEMGVFEGVRHAGVATSRLLDACVALGLLEKRGKEYANTPVADQYLTRSSRNNLLGYVRYSDDVLYYLWAHLQEAVGEGSPRWAQVFGEGTDVATYMSSDPGHKRDFLTGMHGLGLITSAAVITAFDLSRYRRLIDLGGATGHLATAARARYPHMKAILFDLPLVIELVRHLIDEHVEAIGGDFFKDELPDGDLFVLGRILHSQSKEQSLCLLRRIHDRLPDKGAILIAEAFLDTKDPSARVQAHLSSLNMLVVNGGQERTLPEYKALIEEAGFGNAVGVSTGTLLDVILVTK